jgi:hypothetical protein
METTLIIQNYMQEETKSRLKSSNACYQLVHNLLSSSLLYKNIKINIYRTKILPVVLYGNETLSLTLREERRLRVFKNRVLRRILGSKRDKVRWEQRRLYNGELNDCTPHQTIQAIKSRRMKCVGYVVCMGEWRGA